MAEAVRVDRERVAHELHDLAAHHTTAVVVTAKAARKVADAEPGLTPGLMDEIVDQAQGAQSSLRQMVDVLHNPDDAISRQPQPTLADLDALIEAARRLNPDIEIDAEPVDVSDSVALAAYRIVQESLTNCHRHAPGAPISVYVAPVADRLFVEVRNGRPRGPATDLGGGGRGITGMRMRARLLGGTLQADPFLQGWRVEADLPLVAGDSPARQREDA